MFYTKFSPPVSSGLDFTDVKSLTSQSDIADVDINEILRRSKITGHIDPALFREFGSYVDATNTESLLGLHIVNAEAQQRFEALPSAVRFRFGNDYKNLVRFLDDSANDEEAIKLGFKVKKQTPVSPEVGTLPALDINVPTDTTEVVAAEKNG